VHCELYSLPLYDEDTSIIMELVDPAPTHLNYALLLACTRSNS